jgi:colanic acid biosynthesis glycosyl transferase WcaI
MSVWSFLVMTKLLVCCQLFYPELISTGQSMTELCESFSKKGVEIEVLCAQPTLHSREILPPLMMHEGITVRRLWSTRFPKLNIFGKVLNHLTFAWSLGVFLSKNKSNRPLLVVTNPPFLPFLVIEIFA